jgi:hypothetical protein
MSQHRQGDRGGAQSDKGSMTRSERGPGSSKNIADRSVLGGKSFIASKSRTKRSPTSGEPEDLLVPRGAQREALAGGCREWWRACHRNSVRRTTGYWCGNGSNGIAPPFGELRPNLALTIRAERAGYSGLRARVDDGMGVPDGRDCTTRTRRWIVTPTGAIRGWLVALRSTRARRQPGGSSHYGRSAEPASPTAFRQRPRGLGVTPVDRVCQPARSGSRTPT